jgi:hypothetical protein
MRNFKMITDNNEVVEIRVRYTREGDIGYFHIEVIRQCLVLFTAFFRDDKCDPIKWDFKEGGKRIPDEAIKLFHSFRNLCDL